MRIQKTIIGLLMVWTILTVAITAVLMAVMGITSFMLWEILFSIDSMFALVRLAVAIAVVMGSVMAVYDNADFNEWCQE